MSSYEEFGALRYVKVPSGTIRYHQVPVGTSVQVYQEDQDKISGATYISDVVFLFRNAPRGDVDPTHGFLFHKESNRTHTVRKDLM